MNKLFFTLVIVILFCSCKDEYQDLKDGLYADIETSKGNIIVALEYQKTPITVASFVTLAEGKNPFVMEDLKNKPFFDGLSFHRVVPDFVIQTGDPLGNGAGDAGYMFGDEITDLKHDAPGILSMANSGPGTNSSQFFITHDKTPWLDGKHSVFGKVINKDGMDIVKSIQVGDIINTITIIRKGEDVKKFDAVKIFSDYFRKEAENRKKQQQIDEENKRLNAEKYRAVIEAQKIYFDNIRKTASKTTSGLVYKILSKGNGKKPQKGQEVFVDYSGFLEDGTLFQSTSVAISKKFGTFDEKMATQIGYLPIPYEYGSPKMVPGMVEGLNKLSFGDKAILFIPSQLAYGEQGAGNVIPPNATIIFEVELKEKQK